MNFSALRFSKTPILVAAVVDQTYHDKGRRAKPRNYHDKGRRAKPRKEFYIIVCGKFESKIAVKIGGLSNWMKWNV